MTERVCKTCCWYYVFECQLEPVVARKKPQDRCRHHSFTTGWLEDEPSEDLATKVKALSERCKDARDIIETLRGVETTAVSVKDMRTWLAGEDE